MSLVRIIDIKADSGLQRKYWRLLWTDRSKNNSSKNCFVVRVYQYKSKHSGNLHGKYVFPCSRRSRTLSKGSPPAGAGALRSQCTHTHTSRLGIYLSTKVSRSDIFWKIFIFTNIGASRPSWFHGRVRWYPTPKYINFLVLTCWLISPLRSKMLAAIFHRGHIEKQK